MSLIDRLRGWIRGLFGGSAEPDDGEGPSGSAEPEEPRLDPENVTEARTADDTDGAAQQLSELRNTREQAEAEAGSGGQAEPETGSGSHPPDDTLDDAPDRGS